MSISVSLASIARAAKLHPSVVIQTLYNDYAITTSGELKELLANADKARTLPDDWRDKLGGAVAKLMREDTTPWQWRPNGTNSKPRIVVVQGDLTACPADAIVNPANSRLSHGGGLALAIVRRGGQIINDESHAWIREHQSLDVGKVMVTSAGAMPSRYVIHTVGPRLGGMGTKTPTSAEAQLLRDAVWNSLCEADKLQLTTIAIPGISSGIFGYPRDLAAKEILNECVRFCRPRSEDASPTTLETIALMNIDNPTCESFVTALKDAAGDASVPLEDDPFEEARTKEAVDNQQELVDAMTRAVSTIVTIPTPKPKSVLSHNEYELLFV